jgi:hypothetical protein
VRADRVQPTHSIAFEVSSPEGGMNEMAEPVMVIIRFAGDVDEVLPRWEQAVKLWQEQFGSEYRLPATVVAEGESGGLVVVNVFATDQDHLNFGQNMGGPMAAVGLTGPFAALEHLPVRKIDWDETRLG